MSTIADKKKQKKVQMSTTYFYCQMIMPNHDCATLMTSTKLDPSPCPETDYDGET